MMSPYGLARHQLQSTSMVRDRLRRSACPSRRSASRNLQLSDSYATCPDSGHRQATTTRQTPMDLLSQVEYQLQPTSPTSLGSIPGFRLLAEKLLWFQLRPCRELFSV